MFKSALQEIFYVIRFIVSCKKNQYFFSRFSWNFHTFKVKYFGIAVAQTSVILDCQTVSILQNDLNLQFHTVSWIFQQLTTVGKLESYYYQTLVIGEQ